MSVVTPMQSSFNGGELSPNLQDRVDLGIRQISVKSMIGFMPTLQGPAEACPGTVMVVKSRAPNMRIYPYVFNSTQSYVLEFTEYRLRFITQFEQIKSGGEAYEVETPYTAAQLKELTFEQSLDALYIYHPDVHTQRLSRTSAFTFELSPVIFEGGPFEARNRDKDITITSNNAIGNVTLNASANIFKASDVGRLLRLEAVDLGYIAAWDVGLNIGLGDYRQSNGLVYKAASAGFTGGIAPKHTEGLEWDGSASANVDGKEFGVQWEYVHSRYGLVRLVTINSASEAVAFVLDRIPETIIQDNTWRWSFGAFSHTSGWPHCGRIFDERHCLAHHNAIHASVALDLDNFSPLNELGDRSRDMAFSYVLPAADMVRWMAVDDLLLVGTGSGEWTIGPSSAAAGIGPGSVKGRPQTSYGSALTMPIITDGRILFIQRGREKIQEFAYGVNRDRFESPDLVRKADHIGAVGLNEICYQAEPARLIWAARDDFSLACAIYEPSEEALGWARRYLGGGWKATTICSTPDPTGKIDILWIGVIAPDGEGYILRMQSKRNVLNKSRMRVMTDASWLYDEDEPTDQINAPWLKNQRVQVVADGQYYLDVTLDGAGQATLPAAHKQIIAGLPFPAEIELLPIEAGGDNGPAFPKRGKISRVALGVVNSAGLKAYIQGVETTLTAGDNQILGTASELQTGIFWMGTVGKWDNRREIKIVRDLPIPATVTSLMAQMTVQQSSGRT